MPLRGLLGRLVVGFVHQPEGVKGLKFLIQVCSLGRPPKAPTAERAVMVLLWVSLSKSPRDLVGTLLEPPLGIGYVRVGFWRFLFSSRRIFSRILSPDFCSSFLWPKVPRKILQENPHQNPSRCIQQQFPTHFCRGAGPYQCRQNYYIPFFRFKELFSGNYHRKLYSIIFFGEFVTVV